MSYEHAVYFSWSCNCSCHSKNELETLMFNAKKILIRRNNYKLIIDENWITVLCFCCSILVILWSTTSPPVPTCPAMQLGPRTTTTHSLWTKQLRYSILREISRPKIFTNGSLAVMDELSNFHLALNILFGS